MQCHDVFVALAFHIFHCHCSVLGLMATGGNTSKADSVFAQQIFSFGQGHGSKGARLSKGVG